MELNYFGPFEPPAYETIDSAGFDLRAQENAYIPPGEAAVIPTGCYLTNKSESKDVYLRIAPRSGLAVTHGIDVLAGVVDADYPDEIKVILHNTSKKDVIVQAGSRIAQGIVETTSKMKGVRVKDVVRKSGFGSTGK